MAERDDDQLWERARTGDRQAIDQILRRNELRVYRFGLRMCGDEDAAREVLQRTLITAFEQLGSFRGEARISTWLYAIARSHCSRLHRRTRSAPIHDIPFDVPGAAPALADASVSPDEKMKQAEMANLVATAISMLPTNQREAVVLKDVEDLALEEAAKIARLELPAFKSRLHRARQALKGTLATLLREREERGESVACEGLAHTLHDLEGKAIDQKACDAIEGHVSKCPVCKPHLGSLQEAASLCRRVPEGDVPEPVRRAVRAALEDVLVRTQPRPDADAPA